MKISHINPNEPGKGQHEKKKKMMRADRDLLRRLLVESHGYREIDMKSIVEHKFSLVPISPATIDGKLNKCCKSDLADIFTEGLDLKGYIPKTSKRLCVLINEAALI